VRSCSLGWSRYPIAGEAEGCSSGHPFRGGQRAYWGLLCIAQGKPALN